VGYRRSRRSWWGRLSRQDVDLFGGEWTADSRAAERYIIASPLREEVMSVEAVFTWLQVNPIATAALAAIAACFSAMFALGSAIGSNRSANKTRKNTQAQLMSSLFDAYAASSMLDAELCLLSWAIEHGQNFASEFAHLRRTDYPKVQTIDHSRRQVSHYSPFAQIWR
jgi:hypothetical protein